MSFDPDAYLAQKTTPQGSGFNPDTYLAQKAAVAPTTTAAQALGRGAVQGATLGFGDEIEGGVQALGRKILPESMGGGGSADAGRSLGDLYRESRDAARRENADAQRDHPGAYVGGNLAGGLATAPLIASGGTLAGAAKVGAALGAANGFGSSNADLTTGDLGQIGQAAKDTAIGGALGAGAGAIGHGIGTQVPKVASWLGDELRDLAERKAVNALRPTAGEVRTLIQQGRLNDTGRFLLDNGVVEAGDTFRSIAPKAEGARAGMGQALDAVIKDLDARGATVSRSDLAQRFLDAASEAERGGPPAKPLVDKFLGIAEQISNHPGPDAIPLSLAEEWKRAAQAGVNYAKQHMQPLQLADEEAASLYRKTVDDAADKAAAGSPLAGQFQAAKDAYGKAATASSMADGALARAEARNIASPSDKGIGLVGVAAGALTGHPVAGAALGVAGGAVNNIIRNRAASTIAVGADSIADQLARIASTSPQRLGKYGAVLSSALARGGQDAFNAHMYVLGQSDPEFQALTKKLSAEGPGK